MQEARANGVVIPTVTSDPTTVVTSAGPAGAVTDPETGVAVPVVPVQENVISQPITQPVPSDEDGAQN